MQNVFQKEAGDAHLRPGAPGAVIRASICTGEKAAGFRDLRTGRFTEIMLLRTPGDLEAFRRLYGISGEIPTRY